MTRDIRVYEAMHKPSKRWRWVAVAFLVTCGIVGCTLLGLRSALHRVPDFYAQAVAKPAAAQEAAGEALERNVLDLHNNLRAGGPWSAVFTEAQINGWLAADLPEKFPALLPPEIQDPRVDLTPGQIQLACRYAGSQLTTVVTLTLEVRLADEPNTLAVRMVGAQAGLVPLPLRRFLDQVTESVRRADLLLRWVQAEGDPVALLTLDEPLPLDNELQLVLERIDIREGEVLLAGRTVPPGESGRAPAVSAERR